jgi:hypothetical protein
MDPVVMAAPPGGWRRSLVPAAQAIQLDDQRRLGLRTTGALARRFNRGAQRYVDFRRRVYEERFDELLEENGGLTRPPLEMRDGFAFDHSMTLPHLDALLEVGERIIEERGGRQWEFTKPFLQDISPERALDDHPPLLDFITSSDVIATVAPVFGYVPALPGTLPEGVRLQESSTRFDPQARGPWRSSQLYHLDYHSTPTVYVMIAAREIRMEDGPWHFLGAEASRKVAETVGYGRRPTPYRLTDADVYSIVDESEVEHFAGPAGTVLFIESSACFHFGSREPTLNRYQWQYGLTSPVRNDFLELWREQRVFPVRAGDSRLRRLVLDRSLLSI